MSLSDYFSSETLQARREWHEIFKVVKGKKKPNKPCIYPARLLSRMKGKIKNFLDKQNIKELLLLNQPYKKC